MNEEIGIQNMNNSNSSETHDQNNVFTDSRNEII